MLNHLRAAFLLKGKTKPSFFSQVSNVVSWETKLQEAQRPRPEMVGARWRFLLSGMGMLRAAGLGASVQP